MGADLLCFMLVGPAEVSLTEEEMTKAAAAVFADNQKLVETVEKAIAEQENVSVEQLRELGDDYESRLSGYFLEKYNDDVLLDADEVEIKEKLIAFIEFWNAGGGYRDCGSRLFDDETRQVLVAGEMSWGDEPQGAGYQACKEAVALGLLAPLGIE